MIGKSIFGGWPWHPWLFINVHKDIDKCDLVIITAPDKKTKIKLDAELYKKVESSKKLKTCVVHELLNHPEKIITKS